MTGGPLGEQPEPKLDPEPPEGPGGPDAVPDWEAAGPDPAIPDQPRSAQVDTEEVPDEIEEPEELDESDGADSHTDGSDEAGHTEAAGDAGAERPERDIPA